MACIPIIGCTQESAGYRGSQTSANAPVGNQNPILADDEEDSEGEDDIDADKPKGSKDPKPEPKPTSTPVPTYCGGLGIVGGTPTNMNDMVAKSTVRLIIGQGMCTGTIIGPNQISTAAHCLEESPAINTMQIQFGIMPATSPDVKVKGYSVHPDYKGLAIGQNGYPNVRLFDVAVIAFDGKIPQGFGIAPVGSTANLQAGTEVTLAGYGAYSDDDMQDRPLTQVKKAVALFDRNFKEIQLQVGGQQGGCFGDSGGPSYILSENGMCLKTLSTTTGPGRSGDGSCTQGSGTLMDITAHQGWMSCAYEKLGTPLPYLLKDESKDACDRTTVVQ
ncbi:trypsin-like serine protease [Oligoflexus tunisiensis]|uniref:trypsin-like serine protease n=1 Tax=Oligoflexus tunisiensis TaxID=708132 RepID=UPI001C408010|nr:trypsin-like serine protease [Oligoflexus tunisiensis]